MLGHRELSFDDYLSMLRRRAWLIAIPALIGPLVAFLISLGMPSRYVSSSKVLIEQPQVSHDYVRPVVTAGLETRLATMREQVLSRTRLQPLIERFGLYKETSSIEDQISGLQHDVEVRPLRSFQPDGHSETTGFSVSVMADQPKLSQQLCQEITAMFMAENLRTREQMTQSTTDFLGRQVEEAKQKLDDQDSRLAEFKRKYLGQLPGEEQTNMSLLTGTNSQLDAVTQNLSRLQQDKNYAVSRLQQQIALWEESRKEGANPRSLEQQLAQLQDQLVMLQARYTADHPDVIKTRRDIEQLKRTIAHAENARSETAPAVESQADSGANSDSPIKDEKGLVIEPQSIQQMRNEIRQLNQEIQARTHQQERLQEQIRTYEGRLQLSPAVEEQYKQLTRDYSTALNSYNDLLAKKTQTEIASDLERRQQGEQFRVMDPPDLPMKPTYPNRPLIALYGLGGGLVLGLGIAFGVELMDKSLRTDKDIEFYLNTAAIAVLPDLQLDTSKTKRRMWWRKKAGAAKEEERSTQLLEA